MWFSLTKRRGFILSMVLDFLYFLSFLEPNSFFFFFLRMRWEADGTGSREARKEVMKVSTILKTAALIFKEVRRKSLRDRLAPT